MSSNEGKELAVVLFIAALIFYLALAVYWIRKDNTPPYWDAAWYLYQGAAQLNALEAGGLRQWYHAWTALDRSRPSTISTFTIPFFALFGVSADAGLIVNLISLTLLCVATFALGKSIGGTVAGSLSGIIVGGYPLIVGISHILLVELTKSAIIAITLFFLWKANYFKRTGWTVAVGLCLAIGILIKILFVLFLIGPCVVCCYYAIRENRIQRTRIPLRNIAIALLIPAVIGSSWYVPNFRYILMRSYDASFGVEASFYGPANPMNPRNLWNYFLVFVGRDVSCTGFLLFMGGIFGIFGIRRSPEPENSTKTERVLFLFSSAIPGYLFLTCLKNQDQNHLSGILPSVAVLSGWGLSRLAQKSWLFIAFAVTTIMLYLAVLGTEPQMIPFETLRELRSIWNGRLCLIYPARPLIKDVRYALPDSSEWPLDEILNYVMTLKKVPRIRLGVVPNYPGFERYGLMFECIRRQLPIVPVTIEGEQIYNMDVVVTKSGDQGFPGRVSVAAATTELIETQHSAFELTPKMVLLPDDSVVSIYVRRK